VSVSEWREAKLCDIGEIVGGGTPSTKEESYYGGDIPWITPKDLSTHNERYIYRGERSITEEGLKNSSAKLMPKGTVLFSSRAPIGYVAIAGKELCTNQGFKSLIPKNGVADSEFIYYLFKHKKSDIEAIASGTTFLEVSGSAMKNISILLPPLPEQKAIAATLSALDDMIELNNQINKTLEEMAQAIFKSWFVDFEPFKDGEFEESELGMIPKGWRVGTLGECIAFINGYAFKSKELLDKDIGECYHVFKMGNIKKGGGLNTEGTKSYIEKNKCKNMDKYILQSGDLLMCMTDMKGNVALLGHTALMNEDGKYIVNQRVGLIRVNNNFGIGYPHLYILTNTKDFIENLRAHANSGVQVNLSTKEILSSKIIIPEKSVNDKFNDIVKPYFDEIFCMIKENQILKTIRETLLPKLMSGEIRVPVEEIE